MRAHLQIKPLVACTCLPLPLYLTPVSAGFPGPGEDYQDRAPDRNERLISNPAATFYVRASGDSMRDAGNQSGDILILDRASESRPGKIVMAADGWRTCVVPSCWKDPACAEVGRNRFPRCES